MRRPVECVGVLGVLLVMLLAATAPAATTEEVLAKLAKNEGGARTFEADMKTIMTGDQAGEMTGHMATEVLLKDGKRAGMLMNMRQKMTAEGQTMDVLMVNDGEFLWQEIKHPQMGVMVTKMKPGARTQQTGDTQQFRDMYDLKLVGEEDFDKLACWVLEGTPKKKPAAPKPRGMMGMGAQPEDPAKIRLYIGQKDLMVHRYRAYDKADKETTDMQFTNVKVNGKLDPKLFKYTPPPGATVTDMTQGMPDIREMLKNVPNLPDVGE